MGISSLMLWEILADCTNKHARCGSVQRLGPAVDIHVCGLVFYKHHTYTA